MKPIAIVIPWFGEELKGGAEQQGWQLATRLAARGHKVEVLTTCCRAFQEDWSSNHLKPGLTYSGNLAIRRFRVNRRRTHAFDRVNQIMLGLNRADLKPGVNPVSPADAEIFAAENINSDRLLKFLKQHQNDYHAFLFLPYLYGPILNGLPVVASRAFLQPCLHDEVYAYLPQVANIVHLAQGLLFISHGEAQLAEQLYGPGIIPKSTIAGAAVEVDPQQAVTSEPIQDFAIAQERFVLCLGRRDPGKNTDLLVEAFLRFRQEHPESSLKLVLAGPGGQSYAKPEQGVIDLGLVEESQKAALLANCLALFQPSRNESYSRVIMEAWLYGRPAAAHRDCLATAIAVQDAQGGWLASDQEWTELFSKVDRFDLEGLAELGNQGKAYAQENAVWDKIIQRYEVALGLDQPASTPTPVISKRLKAIHQLLPALAYGDAISNHALAIRDYLRRCGYQSDIFVQHLDERIRHQAKIARPNSINANAGLIYHHSIGCDITPYAIQHAGPKCLIYHNITPAKFFQPYRPAIAKLLETGRAELKDLAQYFPVSVGDSSYNAAELAEVGFSNPGVLPIITNPSHWDQAPDPGLMQYLQDGKTNIIFVGRIAPNKKQDDLVHAFLAYLDFNPNSRLTLVGQYVLEDPYFHYLAGTIHKLGLSQRVMVAGQVNEAQLLAFYKTAHLFWSMSEHEGFCVPLVEAMWFNIPILAYKSSAVPETLGQAGLIFNSKQNLSQVAALAHILSHNTTLRNKVLMAQRRRRTNFSIDIVHQQLDQLVLKLEEGVAQPTHALSRSA